MTKSWQITGDNDPCPELKDVKIKIKKQHSGRKAAMVTQAIPTYFINDGIRQNRRISLFRWGPHNIHEFLPMLQKTHIFSTEERTLSDYF